eukprot:SAG31_NODE_11414_length_1033_cov_1.097430_1_plen_64_part_10
MADKRAELEPTRQTPTEIEFGAPSMEYLRLWTVLASPSTRMNFRPAQFACGLSWVGDLPPDEEF